MKTTPRRFFLLKAVGLFCVFVLALVMTGLIPVFPLRQGRMNIGRVPLFAAWWMSFWTGMALHLLLAASVTGILAIGWRFGSSRKWRYSLRTLLLLMTLVAAVIGIYLALTGAMAFRNG